MEKNFEMNIPKEKFTFVQETKTIKDKKLQTKPVSFLKDAWRRFAKNKSSIVGMCIIIFLVLFSFLAPFVSQYTVSDLDITYADVYPKVSASAKGFWDGTRKHEQGTAMYQYNLAIGVESGRDAVVETYGSVTTEVVSMVGTTEKVTKKTTYSYKQDTYNKVGYLMLDLTEKEYLALQNYQNETGIQVLYPVCDTSLMFNSEDGNYWYKTYLRTDKANKDKTGEAVLDENGNFQPIYRIKGYDGPTATSNVYTSLRIDGDPAQGETDAETIKEIDGRYRYAIKNQSGYRVRVCYYDYYVYKNGFEPYFIFGANNLGQDLFVCIASGTRFSLMLAVGIALINLIIGAIYGAIEGYYGGAVDLTMERISDILSGVPFMVVTVLFQLHFADKVGPLGALIFAFVLTGWIGTASTVRMQFYRFKNQEYVLAARTLGARDRRLITKHIFPNALGTIITGAALSIPSVIFSETSLSYLNIISLDDPASGLTSLGTLLSKGQAEMGSGFFHPIIFPSIVISLLMISFNLFGNGLRDAFNPSLRGSED